MPKNTIIQGIVGTIVVSLVGFILFSVVPKGKKIMDGWVAGWEASVDQNATAP
jgi:hypothetical protein